MVNFGTKISEVEHKVQVVQKVKEDFDTKLQLPQQGGGLVQNRL